EDEKLNSHKDDLKSLKFSADYLLALINDVLTLNKADANGMKLEKAPFILTKLVKNITNSFTFSLQQNNNKIQVRIDDALPIYLIGDSVKLSQILMNLVGNAVKFNENGTIEIVIKSLSKNKDGLYKTQFFIKDNGIGIPLEKQQSIFEEFSQIESNNYNYQGTGLGLPIVKKLLNLYNSEIDLQSSPGNGAIFSFIIDLEENTSISKEVLEVNAVDTPVMSVSENMHILIVDDNKINQKVTQRILEARHFKTTLANDGLQAIEQVQNKKFNLILMDIHMPKMGGIEATEKIRIYNKNIPIIALTAVEIEEARARIIASGMNDIILKPYDVSQFLTTILRHLSATALA
ncbi:MAG: CheY-like chemotaxis protein/two-component sensor histidine kinase, partial [Patiriisocius sp.]